MFTLTLSLTSDKHSFRFYGNSYSDGSGLSYGSGYSYDHDYGWIH